MKKLILIILICTLTGCAGMNWLLGDPTVEGDTGAVEVVSTWLSPWLGGAGAAVVAALNIARRARKTTHAVLAANKEAIDSGELGKAKTSESIKMVLNTAQNSHDDAKLIASAYKKWKAKK